MAKATSKMQGQEVDANARVVLRLEDGLVVEKIGEGLESCRDKVRVRAGSLRDNNAGKARCIGGHGAERNKTYRRRCWSGA